MSVSSVTGLAGSGSGIAVTPTVGSGTGTAVTQTGTTALAGLNTNFSTFLTMLMTQLKNQDPTSPLDSSQFTSELVQFSSVEQQINTNTNLTQLIQLTQASQVEQSSAMLGRPATVTSPQLALQSGTSTINFNTATAEPVVISVYNAAGGQLQSATLTSTAGANTWNWDGNNAAGVTQPDGAYTVTVQAVGVDGASNGAKLPFTVTGKVTGVQNVSGTVQLQMGGLTVPFTAVQSVGS